MRLPSLEPQPNRIPGSGEKSRDRDALQRDHRILRERLAVVRHAQRRNALARFQRGDERLLADELRLQRAGGAFGHRYVQVSSGARLQLALAAFPHLELADRIALLVETQGVVGLEPEVEQLLTLAGAQVLRRRAYDYRHEPSAAAPCRGDEGIAGAFRMAGFHAVHVRVEPQELVAVPLRDVVVAVFAFRIQLIVRGTRI